jgi:mRNA interferase RelE/StbE
VEKYRVLIAASASKELESTDGKSNRARLVKAILSLAANPRGPHCEKLSGTDNRYRIRVGDYRIVYEVDDAKSVVDIVKIGHRREVYRR